MEVVDDKINDLEMQIWELDNETVTTWNRNSTTKAERNKQKTEAWLNMTYSRNLLQSQKTLISRMRKHVDEFPLLAKSQSVEGNSAGGLESRVGTGTFHEQRNPVVFRSDAASPVMWIPGSPNHRTSFDEAPWSDSETVTAEPERLIDLDGHYIMEAGVRMKNRLLTLVDEYEEKIRDCSMRVDGMAMATQWVSTSSDNRTPGGTTLTPSPPSIVPWRNKHGNCNSQRPGLEPNALHSAGHDGLSPRNVLRCKYQYLHWTPGQTFLGI